MAVALGCAAGTPTQIGTEAWWQRPLSSNAVVLFCALLSFFYSLAALAAVLSTESLHGHSIVLLCGWAVICPSCSVIPSIFLGIRQRRFLTELEAIWNRISLLKFTNATEQFYSYASRAPPDYAPTCSVMSEALQSLTKVTRYIPNSSADGLLAGSGLDVSPFHRPAALGSAGKRAFQQGGGVGGGGGGGGVPVPVPAGSHIVSGAQSEGGAVQDLHQLHQLPRFGSPLGESIEVGQQDRLGAVGKPFQRVPSLGLIGSGGEVCTTSDKDDMQSECSSVCDTLATCDVPERRSSHTSIMRAVATIVAAKNAFTRKLPELTTRKVTTELIVNMRGFSNFVKATDVETVVAFHTKWLETVAQDVKKETAFIERFVGDEVQINFGGIIPCSAPGLKAGRFALKLRERLEALQRGDNKFSHIDSLPITYIGAAQGPAICGHVGIDGLKSTVVLGRLVGAAKALLAVAQDTGFDIVVDRRIADDCQGHITSVPVDVVQVGTDGAAQEVCYPLHYVGNSPDEWLYSINTDLNYERAWKILRSGDVALAADLMGAYASQSHNTTAGLVSERLKHYIDEVRRVTGEPPTEYCRSVRMLSVQPRPLASLQNDGPASPRLQVSGSGAPLPRSQTVGSGSMRRHTVARSGGAAPMPPNLVASPSFSRLGGGVAALQHTGQQGPALCFPLDVSMSTAGSPPLLPKPCVAQAAQGARELSPSTTAKLPHLRSLSPTSSNNGAEPIEATAP